MKILIVTCFESNEERMGFVYDACISRGYDVKAITSDFSHIRKEKRDNVPSRFIPVETKPYRKNLSIERMLSHRTFARDAFCLIEKEDPDLIWLMAPANSLIKEAKRYKRKHPEKKLIIDIIDMWPESLPFRIDKNIFPLNLWRDIRSRNIGCCDHLVTECDLYQDILKKEYGGQIDTVRWARDGKSDSCPVKAEEGKLSLCYIGSINNIIDADRIREVISEISLPVILHVIGEGENVDRFLNTLKPVCEVMYHGAIRDKERKKKIFESCHAGINIYKEGLYIGLTVKCIDYFQNGLPIINNIKGDTWDLVNKYGAGFNLDKDTKIDGNALIEMRKNNQRICDLFDENLTKEVFINKCLKVIDEVDR